MSARLTPRRITTAVILSVLALPPLALSAPPAVAAAAAVAAYHTGSQTIGYSAQHRPINLTIIGSPTAPKRAMFIGAIHGNERGGVAITNALRISKPPAGVAYFVISLPKASSIGRCNTVLI